MPETIDRRTALARIGVGLAALWSAVFGGLAAVFALSPLRNARAGRQINLGSMWDFSDTFRLVKYERELQDGWQSRVELVKLFVRVDAEGNPEVFSATCTHLGCAVNWEGDSSEFVCPCHGGRYAADGTVVAGPPPASLPRLEAWMDENEELVVELS